MSCTRHLKEVGRLNPLRIWLACICCGVFGSMVWAQDPEQTVTEPEVFSMFPFTGQQGQVWKAEIRGQGLEGAYGVWFDCDKIQATVKSIETFDSDSSKAVSPQDKKPALQRVSLEVTVASGALIGIHKLRLLCARGLSNSFPLYVDGEPVLLEDATASSSPSTAQRIPLPAVVSGKVGEEGEVDYFAVDARAGSWLSFEVSSFGADFDPVITLYEPTGSWFDPQRLRRLDYNDDATPRSTASASLKHWFEGAGRYVVAVGAFVGLGKPDYCYRLRVVESRSSAGQRMLHDKSAHLPPVQWREREFTRRIETDRLKMLWSRGVPLTNQRRTSEAASGTDTASEFPGRKGTVTSSALSAGRSPVQELQVVSEREPNDMPSGAIEIAIPAIVEGAVGSSGDVDQYRIRVSQGESLTFEIQTMLEGPPLFSPHLEALDSKGGQLFNNVYQRIGGDGDDWVQSLEPKCVYTFEKGGEYWLRIRDLTSRSGSPEFAYRLLIRPQIPHVGDIDIKVDRFNLVPQQAKKLTVVTGHEEGFDGQIAIAIENLPPGVIVLPASDPPRAEGPPFAKVHPERFIARSHSLTLMLYAESGAPSTKEPVWARVKMQPIVGGTPGTWTQVGEVPLMVLKNPWSEGTRGAALKNPAQP